MPFRPKKTQHRQSQRSLTGRHECRDAYQDLYWAKSQAHSIKYTDGPRTTADPTHSHTCCNSRSLLCFSCCRFLCRSSSCSREVDMAGRALRIANQETAGSKIAPTAQHAGAQNGIVHGTNTDTRRIPARGSNKDQMTNSLPSSLLCPQRQKRTRARSLHILLHADGWHSGHEFSSHSGRVRKT